MTPIIHFSVGNISVLPMSTIIPRQEIRLTRCSLQGKYAMLVSSSRSFQLPQSSLQLVQIYRRSCYVKPGSRYRIVAAVESDVTIEEPNFATSEETDEVTEIPDSIGTSEPAGGNPVVTSNSKNRGKRPRNVRKSEMPPVKNEELVPGASFMGKVVSIQPFGAFVDFGAYTDGLVHVSRLSGGFVKDVGSLVSIGQEVKVRIVEVNMESGRISLTMRDGDDANKSQQRKDAPSSGMNDKPRPARRNATRSAQKRDEVQKSSKFVKGQVLDGTVKNITRSGAFVSLPEGEEGFLPVSEEYEGFGNLSGNTSLQVGQQVNVRVLRITRGQVTLTMKKEEDVEGLNMQLNQGVVHVATNPFELAFRKNKEIAAFLDEREKAQKASETSEEIGEKVDEIIMKYSTPGVGECTTTNHSNEIGVPFASGVELEVKEITSNELPSKASVMDSILTEPDEELMSISTRSIDGSIEHVPKEESSESSIRSSVDLSLTEVSVHEDEVNTDEEPGNMLSESPAADSVLEAPILDKAEDFGAESETIEEAVITSNSSISKEDEPSANVSSVSSITGSASTTNEGLETGKDDKILEGTERILTSESSVVDEDLKADGLKDANITAGAVSEDAVGSGTSSEIVNGASTDSITGEGPVRVDVTPEEVNGGQVCDSIVDANVESETTSLGNEIASADSEEAKVEVSEAPNEESGIAAPERTIKATISAALVKQLREETGAGMMDCKKALAETGGDIIKAQEFLRKKGLASADKKASRATAEGRIGSYIHDNRIGVLIEVNCETDFVSRGEIFKELVDDLTMQVAACPQVQYLVTDDVPEEIVNKEREIEMQKEDLLTKPEQIRSKIVDGRIRKRLEEFALLEQPYIKNDKVVVKDLVKQTIATIGENIKLKRFVRYNLGEGLEKKTQDFAAEVAAQTAARSTSPAVPKDQSAESKAIVEKQPTVVVSAALVKQLREETGAGMMDCKKALTETGGDLEKGLEYLRKKGLSSAEKKSSRLAAEGRIGAYIHDSRIGTLIEVNCETDFVGRSEKFKELVDDLAMQVVACPQVEFVSVEEIPESIVNKEKEIEMHREDLQSKPENIREKIVEGRISKTLGELALLEQPYIKDDSIKVKDLVKQTVAALGENIKVRRFVRFTLGEKKD